MSEAATLVGWFQIQGSICGFVCNGYMMVLSVESGFRLKWWLNSCVMDTCEDVSRSGFSNKVVSDPTLVLEASL